MLDIEKLTDIELKLINNGLKELTLSTEPNYYKTQLNLIDASRDEIRRRGIESNVLEIDRLYKPDLVNVGKAQGADGKWMK